MRSPVTIKTKLYVTNVNSFQPSPIFCHKELHLRCHIGLELNTETWSTKTLKAIRRHPLHDSEETHSYYKEYLGVDTVKLSNLSKWVTFLSIIWLAHGQIHHKLSLQNCIEYLGVAYWSPSQTYQIWKFSCLIWWA